MQPANTFRFPVLAPILAALLVGLFALPTRSLGDAGTGDPYEQSFQATPDAGAAQVVEVQLVSFAQAGVLCLTNVFGDITEHACVDEILRVSELPRMLEDGIGDQVP